MYARSTTVRGSPQAMDDGIAYVRGTVMPAVAEMDGCVGLSMLADRDSGRCIITTAWADADAMHRSADGVMALRRTAAEILRGEAVVQEWEIALLHRLRGTHNGACARVTWSQCAPADIDSMLDAFRMSIIPRLEDLPGFDSVSVMVDRTSGRTAVAASYDSRHSMNEADRVAASLRKQFNEQTGAKTQEVGVFDLVLAHLRVPETV